MDLTLQYRAAGLFAYFVNLFKNVGNAHCGGDFGHLRSCFHFQEGILWRCLLPSLHRLNI